MFESMVGGGSGVDPLGSADLLELVALLAGVAPGETDRECVDRLTALERIKAGCAAAQARVTADLDARRAARGAGGGTGAGLGAQVGLARRESPHRGRRHLGLARALGDLPHTRYALERGDLSEESAQSIADETRELTREDRLLVDAELAEHAGPGYEGLGGRTLQYAVRRIVLRIDEAGVLTRRAKALAGRRVTGRTFGDGTAQVSAVVADWQYAAVMTSLNQAAATARAAGGDDRTRGQVLADTFVARLTGQVTAQRAPVALQLIISAETLLGDDTTPAHLDGVGPIPATVARRLVATSPETSSSIRRLFACPESGLVAMDSTARRFPAGLQAFVAARDGGICRTPWCDAPIRHGDHPEPVHLGGHTDAINSQGLCEACNYTKENPGWRHRTTSEWGQPHTVTITTPTGHTHHSRAPDLPTPPPGPTIAERITDLARNLVLIA